MTHRLKLNAEINVDLSLVAHVSEGIFIANRNGVIVWANPSFERISGYALDEAVGKPVDFLRGTFTDKEEIERLRESVQQGSPISSEILNYRKDGKPFWSALTLTPVKNEQGEIAHFVGVMRDVTERKETERQIAKLQAKLAGIKILEGWIMQCAWDKTVKDKKGNYISLEEFVERYTDARFTHGMSPSARERARKKKSS
ncbi:MAG: PAS domain-containing protein [Chloroherpetonaceae bacterium]|nr:PAS domain-containing protein [Chloroherpetonaceae bacterium]MDW8437100.1 PAS domain-containing protein [Chloroherpetonaceae bacterium]